MPRTRTITLLPTPQPFPLCLSSSAVLSLCLPLCLPLIHLSLTRVQNMCLGRCSACEGGPRSWAGIRAQNMWPHSGAAHACARVCMEVGMNAPKSWCAWLLARACLHRYSEMHAPAAVSAQGPFCVDSRASTHTHARACVSAHLCLQCHLQRRPHLLHQPPYRLLE